MPIISTNDLREGAYYRLPTGLVVQAWCKELPSLPDLNRQTWVLVAEDRLYLLAASGPARGQLMLISPWAEPDGVPPRGSRQSPYSVRDLLPLGESDLPGGV